MPLRTLVRPTDDNKLMTLANNRLFNEKLGKASLPEKSMEETGIPSWGSKGVTGV